MMVLTLDSHKSVDCHHGSNSSSSLDRSDDSGEDSTKSSVDDQEERGREDGQEGGGDESEDAVRGTKRREISDATREKREPEQQSARP